MKKKYLLHVCCGPCSVALFEELQKEYDVTVHFYNPNIHPEEEYEKRKYEVVKLCTELHIPMVEETYNPEGWFSWTKEHADEKEGGERCQKCFHFRLNSAVKYAKENGFQIFGTTLTSGRNKKASIINAIGKSLANEYGIEFHEEDWKKGGRQEQAKKLIEEKGIYRQDYCGCIYSKRKE